jgi:flagellar biosynthetic protein FlhB
MATGSEQEQDRTEPATPFKLREARKRGQVAKSMEINSLLLLSVALFMSYAMGEGIVGRQLALSKKLLSETHRVNLDGVTALGLFRFTFESLLGFLWPFIGAIMITGILANLFQTGPVFSFFPLKPDVNRINPVQGFKRFFSKKLLFESIKTFVKMVIFGSVIYFAIVALLPGVMAMVDTDPKAYPELLLHHGRGLVFKLMMVVLLVALLDLLFTRWDFSQRMRMSRRELKEEIRRREGDPQIRARRRQLQKESVVRAGAVRRVPDADVMITNPTRLAVALKYERGAMTAPEVIAKGAGELAAKMKETARLHEVPIVENKSLAKALFKTSRIDEKVPEQLFPAVAKILAWIYVQRDQRLGKLL